MDEILSDIVWSVTNVKFLHIPVEVGTLLGAAVEMYYELGYKFVPEKEWNSDYIHVNS